MDEWAGGQYAGFGIIGDWKSCLRVFVGWGGLGVFVEPGLCVGKFGQKNIWRISCGAVSGWPMKLKKKEKL